MSSNLKNVWAVIPARGGSKGVQNKNLRSLGGKPLVAWTIEAARNCSTVSRVIVSTNDPEIARVSRKYDAEVPFMRPEELCTDQAGLREVIDHTVDALATTECPDAIMTLYPTHPFRDPQELDRAVRRLDGYLQVTSAIRAGVDFSNVLYQGRPVGTGLEPPCFFQPTGSFIASRYIPKGYRPHEDPARFNDYLKAHLPPDISGGGLAVLEGAAARIDIDTEDDLALAAAHLEGRTIPHRQRLRLSTYVMGLEPIICRGIDVDKPISLKLKVQEGIAFVQALDSSRRFLGSWGYHDLRHGPLFGASELEIHDGHVHYTAPPGTAVASLTIAKPVSHTFCPLALPFSLPPLWSWDPNSGTRTNLLTGSPIVGRQQEPELHPEVTLRSSPGGVATHTRAI